MHRTNRNQTSPTASRRLVLQSIGAGFASLALTTIRGEVARSESQSPLAAKPGHFPAKAKRVIFLCMSGGPSHVDLLDYKPELQKRSGQYLNGKYGAKLFGSPFSFAQHGQSGQWMSSLLPHLSKQADKMCIINSMHTDLPNHAQAFKQMHTGSFQFIRPSMGAWAIYGLGSENTRLPGFITINPPSDNGGALNYGSAFLPAVCQGTKIGTNQIPRFYAKLLGVENDPGPPLRNIVNTRLSRKQQRRQLDFIRDLNTHKLERDGLQPEVNGAIESFELAFRMQDEIPDLLDLRSESAATLKMYGVGAGRESDRFGRQCLLARRFAEAGVRFIEVNSPVGWDQHFRLKEDLTDNCAATDQPMAALLLDLEQRGLLEDTLVVWGGEFGRTPYAQSGTGRDHNNKGYTIWMAGGGVKAGLRYGATDDIGHQAVVDKVHIHDWHATVLHLLGLDHERLTFNYAGRDFRLTDVYGNVISDIIA